MPNFMSASLSWRKICPAASAIWPCIARSCSSFLPSVCGRNRTTRSRASRQSASAGSAKNRFIVRSGMAKISGRTKLASSPARVETCWYRPLRRWAGLSPWSSVVLR